MGRQTWPIVLFVLGIVAAFVYLGNVIPQIESEPVEADTTVGSSSEALATAGRRLFMSDRAQCLTCHSLGEDPKARCPNLEGVGQRAAHRQPGVGAAEYLVESLYDPNAYIVPGYQKNQMTPANKPPLALTHDELFVLTVFLGSLGGRSDEHFIEQVRQVQEPWRQGLLEPDAAAGKARVPILPGDVDRGAGVFQSMGCAQCHRLDSEWSPLGPDLNAIGASRSAHYILESILDPGAVIVKGFAPITVVWKDKTLPEIQGLPVEWIPNEQQPHTLRLSAVEKGVREEKAIELSAVAQLGDTVVVLEKDGETVRYIGDYVSGDENTGLALLSWEQGSWVERRIPPEAIQSVRLPASPMPPIFGALMTPRQIYDLLAFLLTRKGNQ